MMVHPALFAVALVLAGSLDYEPSVLVLRWPDGHEEQIATTSPDTCEQAVRAVASGMWQVEKDIAPGARVAKTVPPQPSATCIPGDRFAPGSTCIAGFNCR